MPPCYMGSKHSNHQVEPEERSGLSDLMVLREPQIEPAGEMMIWLIQIGQNASPQVQLLFA
eukprot:6052988-Ditylum_brightwellii.AAC.1